MESPTWRRQLAGRFMAHWRLKAVGIPLFIVVFFVGYFLTLKFPAFPILRVPYLPIDRTIGFHPDSVVLYLSLWAYVSLAPSLLEDRSELRLFGATASALAVVGFAIFFFWPTAVPNPDIDWTRYPSFMWLKTIDASGNACPSLHAGYALFAAVWIQRSLARVGAPAPLGLINICWCAGILYSTLATKQHVMVDMAAGAALGWLAALPRGRRPA